MFAALDVRSGKAISNCMPRHHAKEFLRRIDRQVPKSREVHLLLGNHATHKTPEVLELRDRPADGSLMQLLTDSQSSLHAKTFAVDAQRIFIGSFNFDPRSARLNTEMGLLIESPAIATALGRALDGTGSLLSRHRGRRWAAQLDRDPRRRRGRAPRH